MFLSSSTEVSVGFRPPPTCPVSIQISINFRGKIRQKSWIYGSGFTLTFYLVKKSCCDLNLGESLFLDSGLYLLNGFTPGKNVFKSATKFVQTIFLKLHGILIRSEI